MKMLDLEKFLKKIIPPSTREYRDGFDNTHLIDELDESERIIVEEALIELLRISKRDMLIVDSLTYLKSNKALPLMYNLLHEKTDNFVNIITLTVCIFLLNKDENMIDISIAALRKLEKDRPYRQYTLPSAFYYLAKLKSKKVNNVIGEFVNHKEFLIAYNAKRYWISNMV